MLFFPPSVCFLFSCYILFLVAFLLHRSCLLAPRCCILLLISAFLQRTTLYYIFIPLPAWDLISLVFVAFLSLHIRCFVFLHFSICAAAVSVCEARRRMLGSSIIAAAAKLLWLLLPELQQLEHQHLTTTMTTAAFEQPAGLPSLSVSLETACMSVLQLHPFFLFLFNFYPPLYLSANIQSTKAAHFPPPSIDGGRKKIDQVFNNLRQQEKR